MQLDNIQFREGLIDGGVICSDSSAPIFVYFHELIIIGNPVAAAGVRISVGVSVVWYLYQYLCT